MNEISKLKKKRKKKKKTAGISGHLVVRSGDQRSGIDQFVSDQVTISYSWNSVKTLNMNSGGENIMT